MSFGVRSQGVPAGEGSFIREFFSFLSFVVFSFSVHFFFLQVEVRFRGYGWGYRQLAEVMRLESELLGMELEFLLSRAS